MEMYYLVISLYGRQAISSVVIPEKYTKEQCETVKASIVRDSAICVPAPIDEYCKFHNEPDIKNGVMISFYKKVCND